MFKLNLSSMEWTKMLMSTNSPAPRASFGYSSCDGSLYVYGGSSEYGEHEALLLEQTPMLPLSDMITNMSREW